MPISANLPLEEIRLAKNTRHPRLQPHTCLTRESQEGIGAVALMVLMTLRALWPRRRGLRTATMVQRTGGGYSGSRVDMWSPFLTYRLSSGRRA